MRRSAEKPICLHIVRALAFGGVETQMRIIAANRHQSSFDHQFCAIQSGGSTAEQICALGVRPEILGADAHIPSISALRKLTQVIRSVRPVIVHSRGAEANFHGIIAGRLAKAPVVLGEEVGVPRHSRKAQLAFRFVYGMADGVVAVATVVKKEILRFREADDRRIHVIENPFVALEPLHPATYAAPTRIGYVGRLEGEKNPIAVVRAAAILRDRGLPMSVIIVGEGSQRRMLEDEIRALGLGEFVTLTGFDADPFRYLQDCQIYVQPSISEGFSLALLEAMSGCFAVIASDVGGAPELISHGLNGWLITDSSAPTLAAMIEKVATLAPGELMTIGQRARDSVMTRFSPKAYLGRCDALYRSLLTAKDIRLA